MGESAKVVCFGELLMRLATKRFERFVQSREFEVGFTGAEANAAVSLANFGLESYVVAVVPENEIGQACINYIRQYGVNTDHVARGGTRLGVFYLETGVSQRPSKVIYDRAGSSMAHLRPGQIDWGAILQGKDWFHFSGTVPALGDSVAAATREACAAARKHGLTVSCDLNYRSKLWSVDKSREVMRDLMQDVDVLIGVTPLSADIAGGSPSAESFETAARELHRCFGFKYVAATLRESVSASHNNWSGMLFDGETCCQSRQYQMMIVDRVGGGDAFSGGLIYGLITGMNNRESIEFATAASCLKHSIHGDFNLVSREEVMALVGGDGSGRIIR